MNRLFHSHRRNPLPRAWRRQDFRLRLEELESRVVPAVIDHTNGFAAHLDLIANGSAKYVGSAAELTDGNNGEAGSLFTAAKVDLTNINTSFTFQFRPGSNPIADGLAFVIQGAGSDALGGGGGALGYLGINNSVAITFHTYDHSFTELQVNGNVVVNNNLVGTGIDFNAGAQANPPHTYKATITYSQATKILNETLTDVTAAVTKNYSYTNVDVAGTVGGGTGYVGFTGGTGGLNLFGDVQSWFGEFLSYSSQTLTSLRVTAPATTAIGVPINLTVSALDQSGNPQLNYTGTVHFTSSDNTATLPPNYTFTAADNGQHTFTVTLGRTGNQTITATDTGNGSLTSTATVNVTAGSTIDYSTGFANHGNLTATGSAGFLPIGVFQNHTDVGNANSNPSVAGTASFANGTYTLTGSGSDIGFANPDQDHFQYVYSQGTLSNTSSIIVRVVGVSSTDYTDTPDWTKAVIQVRTSLDPAAPNMTVVMSPHNQSETTWRDTQGGSTGAHERAIGSGPVPGWIRLDRNGTSFTGYWAVDNNGTPGPWQTDPGDTHTSPNIGNANVYVGLGLTAHKNGAVATAVFDNLSISGFTPNGTPAPVAEITNGFNGEAGGLFTNTKVGAKNFVTSFTFQYRPGSNPIADGLAFVIQADPRGVYALGDAGGAIGYGGGNPITNSVAISLHTYDHSFTQLLANGNQLAVNDLTGTGIDFNAGAQAGTPHTYRVDLAYNGTNLTETINDLTANVSRSYSYAVNLATYLGSADAGYAGFTGGTGGLAVTTDIQSWTGQFYNYQQTATSLGVSAPASVVAGTPFSITVTAKDQNGATMIGYQGTVHFTSSDNTATLPANYTFTAADQGVHTFTGVRLLHTGNQTITATDTVTGTVTGNATVNVLQGASSFTVTGYPSPAVAGTVGTITVTARDSGGGVATNYGGTIHFTSNDPQATLPADYTFTTADMGVHTFSVTLKTAGTNRSITVTDASNATGSQTGITITPAATSKFALAYPTTTIAGTAQNLTVTAQDQYGNTTPAYTGTVHFTSSDPQVSAGNGLPANYTFTAADNGTHTFSATLKTAGSQSITATDTNNNTIAGTQFNITVTPAAAATLMVAGFPSPDTAGNVGTVTVTAKDPYGNTATGYRGTVRFSSDDSQATLPNNYTFTATDNGVHAFPVVLKTAGTHAITATDTGTGTITGSQTGIVVNPAAASSFTVSGFPSPIAAGTQGSVTVTAKDPYGNTATGYTGTVHFTSSDPQATLPADGTLNNGTGSFNVTLKTAGSQSITATDRANSTIRGTQSGITVTPLAAATLAVTGFPSPVTAGTAGMFTVTAKDQYGNTAPTYTGTVTFGSSDPQATLPSNYTFTAADNGVHTFSATLRTAGTQAITATDTQTATITGSQSGIQVTGAAAASLVVGGFPSPVTAGMAGTFTVTARDQYGNTATGYTGTVTFSSSDPQAMLPANYTFTAADNGTHTFSATLKTAGSQSITATDTATGTLTGTQSGITVNPAATSTLTVAGFASPVVAGTPGTFTVTAKDAYGNVTPAYTGTVHFSSSDPQADLPGDYTFTAADNGTHTFSATLRTAGTQSITATDTQTGSITGSQTGIVVTPAAASSLLVAGFPSPVTAGTVQTFMVTAKDPYGNTATGYTGTVTFDSSDPRAFLPADYAFTAGDRGTHTFAAAFRTSGLQSLTATDTADGTITGTQSDIQVNPAGFHVTGFPSPVVAGTTGTFTVTAVDAQGHVNLGYTGTVHFTSTDPQAQLPDDYTFTPDDQGVHTFSATLFTAGTQSISVMDTSTSTVAGTQSGIMVTPADFSGFVVAGFPSPTTAGVAANFSVTAVDAYGNTAPTYTGTVTFSSSDPQASLPADYTFTGDDQGVHFFTATLYTAGVQSITAADVDTGLAGTQDGITVNPAGATTLVVGGYPSPTTAGTPGTFTVTVLDNYGNVVTNFTGTVHFTSTDPQAQLPDDYTFTADDMGMHTFTATLFTAGTQSIAATDFADQLNGEQDGIVVTPAAASQFVVAGFPSPITAGDAGTFTVTVEDAYGNVVPDYTGTVTFSSSDPDATLPAPYTFTPADNGVHTFGAVLRTPGMQSIIATDAVNGITGEQDNIMVVAADTGVGNGPSLGNTAAPATASAPAATPQGTARAESPAPAQPAEGPLAFSTVGSPVAVDDFFAAFAGDLLNNHSLQTLA